MLDFYYLANILFGFQDFWILKKFIPRPGLCLFLLLSTLVCYLPTELIMDFFWFINFPIFTPPPPGWTWGSLSSCQQICAGIRAHPTHNLHPSKWPILRLPREQTISRPHTVHHIVQRPRPLPAWLQRNIWRQRPRNSHSAAPSVRRLRQSMGQGVHGGVRCFCGPVLR